jgi:hypothetical protein
MSDALQPFVCVLLPVSASIAKPCIRRLQYVDHVLSLDVQGEDYKFARLTFRYPTAYRVVDEGFLFDQLPRECNGTIGWLWELTQGGWKDQELRRHEYMGVALWGTREYLVIDNECVQVLTKNPPELVHIGAGWSARTP